MLLTRLLAAAALLLPPAAAAQIGVQPDRPSVRYDGHKVAAVLPRDMHDFRTLLALTDDLWSCEVALDGPIAARFSPEQFAALQRAGVPHHILIEDLQRFFERGAAENERARLADNAGFYDAYRTFDEIVAHLQQLAAAYPQLASLSVIGESLESRDVWMLRITGPGPTADRPAVFVNGCQHAREWISPMTVMYLIESLLTTYAVDPRSRAIVDSLDLHFVPVANPDGFVYTFTTDPNWRKNRRINAGSTCIGVDLNRNWGHQWGLANGSSNNPCSGTFRGSGPFSEPETTLLAGVQQTLAPRLIVAWDVHAYGQLILSPWGYTNQPPPDIALFNSLGQVIHDGIKSVNGKAYAVGPVYTHLYPISGGANDWSYAEFGALAWLVELTTSFKPPVTQILPIAQEAFEGFARLAEALIPCYPDCDGSGALDIDDFLCFQLKFALADPYADCDGNSQFNIDDFLCFQLAFALGC